MLVKNLHQCGSCLCLFATGALEDAWAMSNGILVPFTKQQIIESLMDNAVAFAIKTHFLHKKQLFALCCKWRE